MNFISLEFLLFLCVVIAVYFVFPQKFRWIILTVASAVFYFFAGWSYFLFLVGVITVTYLSGLWIGAIDKSQKRYFDDNAELTKDRKNIRKKRDNKRKKIICVVAVCLEIGVLVGLKYLNMIIAGIEAFAGLFGNPVTSGTLTLFLPLGMSFYLFKSLGYVIDVYRSTSLPQTNYFKYFLFIAYFPSLLQGPIERYENMALQLYAGKGITAENFSTGAERMLIGFLKKVAIADVIAEFVQNVVADYSAGGAVIVLMLLMYAVQLYADFSGFMDISIGVSRIFGIELTENFDKPYLSQSIAEFWRRWHITLGAWFRDYLYYPIIASKLGRKLARKKKKWATSLLSVIALLSVWICMGLWHGASLSFLIYGLYHGGIIILSSLLDGFYKKIRRKLGINGQSFAYKAFCTSRTFILVCFGYVFFVTGDLGISANMIAEIFTNFNIMGLFDGSVAVAGLSVFTLLQVMLLIFLLMLQGDILKPRRPIISASNGEITLRRAFVCITMIMCVIIGWLLLYSAGDYTSQFIYFQF